MQNCLLPPSHSHPSPIPTRRNSGPRPRSSRPWPPTAAVSPPNLPNRPPPSIPPPPGAALWHSITRWRWHLRGNNILADHHHVAWPLGRAKSEKSGASLPAFYLNGNQTASQAILHHCCPWLSTTRTTRTLESGIFRYRAWNHDSQPRLRNHLLLSVRAPTMFPPHCPISIPSMAAARRLSRGGLLASNGC